MEELSVLLLHTLPVHKKYTSFHSVPLTCAHTHQTHPSADVCCQMTASPCLLPPPPLLKETVTWPGLTKTDASPLAFPARGRTNLELREKFILPEGGPQGLTTFRSRGRRSKPGSRNASPTRSSSSASHSGASLPSAPSAPTTPTTSASSRVS